MCLAKHPFQMFRWVLPWICDEQSFSLWHLQLHWNQPEGKTYNFNVHLILNHFRTQFWTFSTVVNLWFIKIWIILGMHYLEKFILAVEDVFLEINCVLTHLCQLNLEVFCWDCQNARLLRFGVLSSKAVWKITNVWTCKICQANMLLTHKSKTIGTVVVALWSNTFGKFCILVLRCGFNVMVNEKIKTNLIAAKKAKIDQNVWNVIAL